MSVINSTPRKDGFRMPGEHEPQDEICMIWPEFNETWSYGAKPAQLAWVEVATAISEETPVTIFVSHKQYKNARARLPKAVRLVEMTTNDCWMRDMGASFVINDAGERRAVDWQFNAYSSQYEPFHDQYVAEKMCDVLRTDIYKAPFVLEGGSICVDGEGTVFTTESCLLHPGRNPDLTKEQIEENLREYLNVEKVIWFPCGLHNEEDTHGHVDNIIHVVRPGEVILNFCTDESNPNHAISLQYEEILNNTTDARGRKFKIHRMPLAEGPAMTQDFVDHLDYNEFWGDSRIDGERVKASYSNFLITNKRIVVPQFDVPGDREAIEVLERAYPEHTVVGVKGTNIILGGGNVHCITQQVPSAT